MKVSLALDELTHFVEQRISEQDQDQFWTLAKRVLQADTDTTLNCAAEAIDRGNRYQRLREKHERTSEELWKIAAICREHDFDLVLPNFLSVQRVTQEFKAPFPTQAEIRAGLEREADERKAQRTMHQASPPVAASH